MAVMQEHIKERSTAKRERLEARLTSEQKALLQHAADLQGRTLSDFVLENVLRDAQEVIREHEVIRLTAEDSRIFMEAVLNPPAPSARLRAAAARYLSDVEER